MGTVLMLVVALGQVLTVVVVVAVVLAISLGPTRLVRLIKGRDDQIPARALTATPTDTEETPR